MKITGTFLDEISWDIPHQNWDREEWAADFRAMHAIGIDTVILIRSGLRRFLTYPSQVLHQQCGCYLPPVDLLDLFLELAEEHHMTLFFGTYDTGNSENFVKSLDLQKAAAEEAFQLYGERKAFGGWYLSTEISRNRSDIIPAYAELGRHCKALSNNLPVLISPYIQGSKADPANPITLEQHEKEWNNILSGIEGAVDIVAFQDGHCEYDELADYLRVNTELVRKYHMKSWTNCETFDRDMPIHFLPIKWEKMRLKLQAAEDAGMEKAITFEFSHFMSPNSCYLQARNLFRRYCAEQNISIADTLF